MNKYEKTISESQFLEAYNNTESKSALFKYLNIPNSSTARRFYDIMLEKLDLTVKSNWGLGSISKIQDSDFLTAIQNNFSVRSTLHELGLSGTGANYKCFWNRVEELNIDTTHFTGQGHLKGKRCVWNRKKYDIEEILVKDSSYKGSSSLLKKRLLQENIIKEYVCSCCGINKWNRKDISLQLDHINGINNDNRIENLRLLCPNCHSQTSTYAGKNKSNVSRRGGSRTHNAI